MNKYLIVLNKVLPLTLGVYCLYCTFAFIFNLNLLSGAFSKLSLPHFLLVAVVVATAGVGIELGFRLFTEGSTPKRWLLKFAFGFSAYIFILQLVLTITPSASACSCTTLSEVIMNITDWSRVESAGGLLILSMVIIGVSPK